MTGKELIIYILQNDLVDKPIFENGKFIPFMTMEEAAAKANVGVGTINAWMINSQIPCQWIQGGYYIPANFKSPMEGSKTACTHSRILSQC